MRVPVDAQIIGESFFFGDDVFNIADIVSRQLNLIDAEARTECQKIILSGGTSNMRGFVERFSKELSIRGERYQLVANEDRGNEEWIGASILGSLSTFQKMWISKGEYDDVGKTIVHRKCF